MKSSNLDSGPRLNSVGSACEVAARSAAEAQYYVPGRSLLVRSTSVRSVSGQGDGAILNDDSATFNINDAIRAENGGAMTFTVSLSKPVDTTVTVVAVAEEAGDTYPLPQFPRRFPQPRQVTPRDTKAGKATQLQQ